MTRESVSRRWLLPLLACSLVLLAADVVLACPNCKDALASDPAAMGIVRGYFWSILLMLSMPFTLLASLSLYFYVLVRRARRQAVAAPPADPLTSSTLPAWSPSLDH
ncbi:MAG: hypothetical protein U0935_04640 [Pirellulales bacterium]